MSSTPRPGDYSIPLSELERAVHIPVEEQVYEQAAPPSSGVLAPEDLDRLRLLGITGAGRLRPE